MAEAGEGVEGIGRSQCMFTLSGVFAKSCFIDGGLEGSSRTLDGKEAEAKNQACVLHYKFAPPPQYTPAYPFIIHYDHPCANRI